MYGEDGRIEIVDVEDEGLRRSAASVAAMFSRASLGRVDGRWTLRPASSGRDGGWCDNEPFLDQPRGVHCTAFAIDSRRLVTAGHCLLADGDVNAATLDCADTLFVFDYHTDAEGRTPTTFADEDVYACAGVGPGHDSVSGADWRVAVLDRPHARHVPAVYKGPGVPARGTAVEVIGFPLGLPMKFATGGEVLDHAGRGGHFIVDADVSRSNSGSPVLAMSDCGPVVTGLISRGNGDLGPDPDGRDCALGLAYDKGESAGEIGDRVAGAVEGERVVGARAFVEEAQRYWWPGSCVGTGDGSSAPPRPTIVDERGRG